MDVFLSNLVIFIFGSNSNWSIAIQKDQTWFRTRSVILCRNIFEYLPDCEFNIINWLKLKNSPLGQIRSNKLLSGKKSFTKFFLSNFFPRKNAISSTQRQTDRIKLFHKHGISKLQNTQFASSTFELCRAREKNKQVMRSRWKSLKC